MVALAFTILGLAAQTAEFGTLVWADLAELVAWAALLLSGLKGLYRLERIPHIYEPFSCQAEQEATGFRFGAGLINRWSGQRAQYGPPWSFIPPVRPELPQEQGCPLAKNSIDAFIPHRLEREELKPSSIAARRAWPHHAWLPSARL